MRVIDRCRATGLALILLAACSRSSGPAKPADAYPVTDGLVLARSTATRPPPAGLTPVAASPTRIMVGTPAREVASLASGRPVTDAGSDLAIAPLGAALPEQPSVALLLDGKLPYRTLTSIVYTIGQRDPKQIQLLVSGPSGTAAIPIDLPNAQDAPARQMRRLAGFDPKRDRQLQDALKKMGDFKLPGVPPATPEPPAATEPSETAAPPLAPCTLALGGKGRKFAANGSIVPLADDAAVTRAAHEANGKLCIRLILSAEDDVPIADLVHAADLVRDDFPRFWLGLGFR